MKKAITLLLIILCSFSIQAQKSEVTTYYFIRHAEKDRTDANNKNPDLIEKGKQRAVKWSKVFENVTFDYIYTTNYQRTIQTATPTAENNNLEIQYYNPKELYDKDFQKATFGKTVLIVGHSNTTPKFVNKVIGSNKYSAIDDTNNSNLYIVTITRNSITDMLLRVDL